MGQTKPFLGCKSDFWGFATFEEIWSTLTKENMNPYFNGIHWMSGSSQNAEELCLQEEEVVHCQ